MVMLSTAQLQTDLAGRIVLIEPGISHYQPYDGTTGAITRIIQIYISVRKRLRRYSLGSSDGRCSDSMWESTMTHAGSLLAVSMHPELMYDVMPYNPKPLNVLCSKIIW